MKEGGGRPRTKVVVRMLPANLTSEAFWKLVEEKVADKVEWWYYCLGKASQKNYVYSKAYLDFKSPDSVYDFRDFFHGHTFINARGGEDRATVEYAPYPKVPKAKKKVDPRAGTVESDPDYLKFLEVLKQEVVTLPSAEVQLDKRLAEEKEKNAASGGVAPPILTPIIEEIRAKRAARNAPRTILQAPKRRGDRPKRDRGQGGDKKKDDERRKARRDRGGRKRDRDDKRKRRDDEKKDGQGAEVAGGAQAAAGAAPGGQQAPVKDRERRRDRDKNKDKDKEGKSRNGLWMIKRHLEPGSIQIQARDKPTTPGAAPQQQSQQQGQPQIQILQHTPQQQGQPQGAQVAPGPGVQQQPQQYQRRQDYNRKGPRTNGGGGGGRAPRAQGQTYAPKQQQPQQQYTNYMEGGV